MKNKIWSQFMRIATSCVILLFILISHAGCTAKLASQTAEQNKVVEGLVYQLPATRLEITVTHELLACGSKPEIKIVGAAYTSNLIPDTREEATFSLDTTALQSGTKTIPQAKFTLSNNIITGIDYKAEDKTGEIIEELAKSVALAKGIALPEVQVTMKNIPLEKSALKDEACSELALAALAKKREYKLQLKNISQTIDRVYKQIQNGYIASSENAKLHQRHIVALRDSYLDVIKRLSKGGLDDKSKTMLAELSALLKQHLDDGTKAFTTNHKLWLNEKQAAISALEKRRAEALAKYDQAKSELLVNSTIQWVPMPKEKSTPEKFDVSEAFKWFDPTTSKVEPNLIAWQNTNKLKLSTDCKSQAARKMEKGFKTAMYYRVPRHCSIQIARCSSVKCDKPNKIVELPNIALAQFGYTASLPVSNGPFENSEYAIAFDSNTGRLTGFTFKSEKAALLEAAKSLVKAQDLIKESDIETLDAEKAEIDRKKQLVEAETSLIEAEEKKLKAQKKLEEAQKEEDTDTDSSSDQEE